MHIGQMVENMQQGGIQTTFFSFARQESSLKTVVAAVIAQCCLFGNVIPNDFDTLTCYQLLKIPINTLKCKIKIDAS
jgi:hypothetical protein